MAKLTSNSPWAKEISVKAGSRNFKLTIIWLTALPIKQALLKDRMQAGGVLADSAKEIMGVEENYYAIGVSGLPPDMAEKLMEASLRLANKPEIDPVKGNFESRGSTVELMILFPNTSPITIDDKEVEVILKLESAEVGAKFPLREMVYHEKLEL
jgi:hypothetical protein